jgi:hypothetical protein
MTSSADDEMEKLLQKFAIKIAAAQEIRTYLIGGEALPRIRFGDAGGEESYESDEPCDFCRASKGQFHIVGCAGERCPKCENTLIQCECLRSADDEWPDIFEGFDL